MKLTDQKIADRIQKAYDVTTVCDDGNVHVHCKSNNTADDVQRDFGGIVPCDGAQEGSVVIWVGDTMLYSND